MSPGKSPGGAQPLLTHPTQTGQQLEAQGISPGQRELLWGAWPSRHLQQLQRDEAVLQDRDRPPLCKTLISPG